MGFIKFYILSFFVFFSIDLLWLGVIAKDLYKEQIGFLMTDRIRWGAALAFYCLYLIGLVYFAVIPGFKQNNWSLTLLNGALFGLICYATYDLTNLATLKDWPIKIVAYDLMWGTFISGATSLITFWAGSYWRGYFSN